MKSIIIFPTLIMVALFSVALSKGYSSTNDLPDAAGTVVTFPTNGVLDMSNLTVRVNDPSDPRDAVNLATLTVAMSNSTSTGMYYSITNWVGGNFATTGQLADLSVMISTGMPPVNYSNEIALASNTVVGFSPSYYQVTTNTVESHLVGVDRFASNTTISLGYAVTNLAIVETNINAVSISNRNGVLMMRTNSPPPETWAYYPSLTNVDISGFQITNVSKLSMTGRVVVGFGVFSSTNDVPPPDSSNTWYIYAARVNGTNYLMGVNNSGARAYVGNHP